MGRRDIIILGVLFGLLIACFIIPFTYAKINPPPPLPVKYYEVTFDNGEKLVAKDIYNTLFKEEVTFEIDSKNSIVKFRPSYSVKEILK